MMHEDILAGVLGDKAKPFFIVEPLDFATGHNLLLIFERPKMKKDTAASAMPVVDFKNRSLPQVETQNKKKLSSCQAKLKCRIFSNCSSFMRNSGRARRDL